MASAEGGYDSRGFSWGTGQTRCYVEANITSSNDGAVYISFSGKVRSGNDAGTAYRLSGYGVTCTVSTSSGGSCSASASYNYANWVAGCSGGVWVNRGRSAFNVTITCSYSSYNGASNSGSVSVTVNVGAKPSHTISFNANGGTGAPSNVTKWYGEQITIPSTIPTRTNYRFDGWGTSATSSTASYQPGSSYWISDANATYYAVWTLLYKPPTVAYSDSHRVDSASSSAESALGEYGYFVFDWAVDTEIYPENTLKSIEALATLSDGSTPTCTITGTTSGTSGTIYIHIPVATSLTATVSVTVTDTAKEGTGTANGSIGTGHIPFELANGGTAIGLLNSAGENGSITLGSLTLTKSNEPATVSVPLEYLISALTPKVWRFAEYGISSASTYAIATNTRNKATSLFTTSITSSCDFTPYFTRTSGDLTIKRAGFYKVTFSLGGYTSNRVYGGINIGTTRFVEGMCCSDGKYCEAISTGTFHFDIGDDINCYEYFEGSTATKMLGGSYTYFEIQYLGEG